MKKIVIRIQHNLLLKSKLLRENKTMYMTRTDFELTKNRTNARKITKIVLIS